jgi:hypothetical protein
MLLKRMKSMVALSLPTLLFGAALTALGADDDDFGLLVERQLRENSIKWFGIQQPVKTKWILKPWLGTVKTTTPTSTTHSSVPNSWGVCYSYPMSL